MRTRRKPVVGWLFLLLVPGGCGKRAAGPVEPVATVQVRRPAASERADLVRVGGNVEAYETSEVGFQVAGRVRRVLVEEGQAVAAGQLLAELDPTDYRLGAEMAEREAEAARAMAEKARAGARKQELEQARAAYEQAEDEYQRMKFLHERRSLAPNDFKKIETHWRVAKQRYEEALEAPGARTGKRRRRRRGRRKPMRS